MYLFVCQLSIMADLMAAFTSTAADYSNNYVVTGLKAEVYGVEEFTWEFFQYNIHCPLLHHDRLRDLQLCAGLMFNRIAQMVGYEQALGEVLEFCDNVAACQPWEVRDEFLVHNDVFLSRPALTTRQKYETLLTNVRALMFVGHTKMFETAFALYGSALLHRLEKQKRNSFRRMRAKRARKRQDACRLHPAT